MAQRLYSVGLIDDVRWSKSNGRESCSSTIYAQRIQQDMNDSDQLTRQQRQSSTHSLPIRYSSISRSTQNSAAALSVHIRSMKKSAFKMLCKFISIIKIFDCPKISIA
jgi:hypothetical protein